MSICRKHTSFCLWFLKSSFHRLTLAYRRPLVFDNMDRLHSNQTRQLFDDCCTSQFHKMFRHTRPSNIWGIFCMFHQSASSCYLHILPKYIVFCLCLACSIEGTSHRIHLDFTPTSRYTLIELIE